LNVFDILRKVHSALSIKEPKNESGRRMCGIWALFGCQCPDPQKWVSKLKARGPESMKVAEELDGYMGFTRLAINGLNDAGMQPFEIPGLRWMCNGEIYNAKDLANQYNIPMPSGSDCEVLGPLYKIFKDADNIRGFFRALDGVFAIVLYDEEDGKLVWGRDPYGVRPLFAAWKVEDLDPTIQMLSDVDDFAGLTMKAILEGGRPEAICLASERKAIPDDFPFVMQFRPGCYASVKIPQIEGFWMESYHSVPWLKNPSYSPAVENGYELAKQAVYTALDKAVEKRLMTERPVAALLSGGIDSSLIAALVQRHLRRLGLPPLKTFSIGMPGSTDVKYAKMVADWIGSEHTVIELTADQFFAAIPDVIRDIESYDITTVRASVGNWLVSKAIREHCDCKVVFNGDGSDELFGSYLYFYNAPNDQEFEDEVERLLEELYFYDVLRSDRSISLHGLEPRTPFLDKQFVATCRSVATCYLRPVKGQRVEKHLLRDSFSESGLLPNEVLWRKKEAFSDGVSSHEKSWYQEIQERVSPLVPSDWEDMATLWSHCTPTSAEAFYYRSVYEQLYGAITATTAIPRFWMPRWTPGATDPSARTLSIYTSSETSSSTSS
jgi:asparagine synthase (glutamine-hydrolysing)